ncbi:unnamed protein product, partial [Oikopleura dioica]
QIVKFFMYKNELIGLSPIYKSCFNNLSFSGWQSCIARLISARVILRSSVQPNKLNRFDYCFRRAAGSLQSSFLLFPLFCFYFRNLYSEQNLS